MKKKKIKVGSNRNFVKKYMDQLTAPATHASGKEYDRVANKRNLKKEIESGD